MHEELRTALAAYFRGLSLEIWRLAVDVAVLANDGSALETASLAVRAALAAVELPGGKVR